MLTQRALQKLASHLRPQARQILPPGATQAPSLGVGFPKKSAELPLGEMNMLYFPLVVLKTINFTTGQVKNCFLLPCWF